MRVQGRRYRFTYRYRYRSIVSTYLFLAIRLSIRMSVVYMGLHSLPSRTTRALPAKVSGLSFPPRIWGFGVLGLRIQGQGRKVWGSGVRLQGSGSRLA